MPRPDRRWQTVALVVALAVAALVFSRWPGLDLTVSALFYRLPAGFWLADLAWLETFRNLLWDLTIVTFVVAVVGVGLARTRRPLLGVGPLVLLTLGFIWVQRREARWLIGLGTLGAAAIGVAAALTLGTERVARLPQILGNLFAGDAPGDHTTEIRLSLYRAGWRAFLDSPWLGHGWVRLMKSAAPYQDPALHEFVKGLPQLHNDVFATLQQD